MIFGLDNDRPGIEVWPPRSGPTTVMYPVSSVHKNEHAAAMSSGRITSGPSSRASDFVKPTSPAFDAT
jgi:hypothetical protein